VDTASASFNTTVKMTKTSQQKNIQLNLRHKLKAILATRV